MKNSKIKIIRTSTISLSLKVLLRGQLSFLNKYYYVIGIADGKNDLEDVARNEQINVVEVKMKRNISLIDDIISLYSLYMKFRKLKPQLVHSITPKAGLLSMVAAKMAGVPIRLHTFTGLVFPSKTGFIKKILILMDRILCWAATGVYPEGLGVRNDLLKYKITTKPLKVLGNGNVNGIDLDYFNITQCVEADLAVLKQELKIKSHDFVFLFIGRLVGDKGVNELVSAFNVISNENVKLLLVGNEEEHLDPLTTSTKDIIQKNPNIISVGYKNDVRPYLAISSAFVFPSYREGFPNVVLQAGAMNLPAIVTDINGCNEIIRDGFNGLIINCKNILQLKSAMVRILEDKNLYSTMQKNSRKIIAEKFSQQLVWDAILKEYKVLLKTENDDL